MTSVIISGEGIGLVDLLTTMSNDIKTILDLQKGLIYCCFFLLAVICFIAVNNKH